MSSASATEERRRSVLELIRSRGFVSLNDLRDMLGVSESTIRRDLDALEELGETRRTHGGVFFTGAPSAMRLFENRRAGQWNIKRHVAELASRLIDDHDTVLLDGGSTTYELARQLVGRPLQVVTNSLPVATLFASSDRADLVLLGGYVHTRTGVSLGPYANQMLASLNVQKAVLSIAGADQRGYYNSNLLLVETERAMMQCADQTIVVADSSKFGRSSLARLCPLSQVQTVVVDEGLDQRWQDELKRAGVQLLLASPQEPESNPNQESTATSQEPERESR